MEDDEKMSAEELKLREWLSANDVYKGQIAMQTLAINGFYSDHQPEIDVDELISLNGIDLIASEMSNGFDYRAFQKSEDEDEKEWDEKIAYGLKNPEKFLAYINREWRL